MRAKRTKIPLDERHTLMFVTTRHETIALCETLGYQKRVAWHTLQQEESLTKLHNDLRSVFPQYVEDAKRCLK